MLIDSHIHCGVQNVHQPIELIRDELKDAGIDGGCFFAPVEDVYERYDPDFVDSPSWQAVREQANQYVLDVQHQHSLHFAYYFVWNDFRNEELSKGYKGVKWHRHDSEPVYQYDDPRCEEFLQKVYSLELPIVYEETFENTLAFIERIDGRTPVIIPHLGFLNGGFSALFDSHIWANDMVYGDTALASPREMKAFIERYGPDKLLFGSDFPFGRPASELQKIKSLDLDQRAFEMITSENILRLIRER